MHQKILKGIGFIAFCLLLSLISGTIVYFTYLGSAEPASQSTNKKKVFEEAFSSVNTKPEAPKKEEEGERINFLVAGIDGKDCDAIIFSTFHTTKKKLDLFLIPRNTHYKMSGGGSGNTDRLGDIYRSHNISGLQSAVAALAGLESQFYVVVDYSAFEAIVDALGGVPITVKQRMYYEDKYAKPQLVIDFKPGSHTLKGKEALNYIRYISGSSDNTLQRGENGRTEAMKEFIEASLYRAYTMKLPALISTAYRNVKSDMKPATLAALTTSVVGMKREDIRVRIMPGYYTDNQYYVVDTDKMKLELEKMINED